MKKIALFSITWFAFISAKEFKSADALRLFNDAHHCVVSYLNQPYYPMVPAQILTATNDVQKAIDESDTYVALPIPTVGTVRTLQALGTGLGLTIISSSLAEFVIKSALLAHFITTAKPTLDGYIHTKLTEMKKEKYQPYVPAVTTGLSLLLACKFLY